jgi:hypothetical protein
MERTGSSGFTAAAVFTTCKSPDPPLRAALSETVAELAQSDGDFQRKLGQGLRDRVGRRFGKSEVYVDRSGTEHHAALWRVIRPGSYGVEGVAGLARSGATPPTPRLPFSPLEVVLADGKEQL